MFCQAIDLQLLLPYFAESGYARLAAEGLSTVRKWVRYVSAKPKERPLDMDYGNILIIKLSAIGDVIHALPVSRAIKQASSGSRITWIVEKAAYPLLTNNPDIDEIILFDKPKFKSISGIVRNSPTLMKELRSRRFDLALDLQGLAKSAAIAWMSGAPKKLGYCNMREGSGLISKPVHGPNRDGHVVERYLDVARAIGCKVDKPEWVINTTVEEEKAAEAVLRNVGLDIDSKYIVIAPGTNWESKCWPPEFFSQLADRISQETALPIVIIGAAKDRKLAEEIQSRSRARMCDITGQTSLRELAFILRKSRLFIGGDTGPMHLAVAMGTPVVALFGPTDPKRNGPYGSKNIVVTSHLPCAPCFKKSCATAECMRSISPEMVFAAVLKRMEQ